MIWLSMLLSIHWKVQRICLYPVPAAGTAVAWKLVTWAMETAEMPQAIMYLLAQCERLR